MNKKTKTKIKIICDTREQRNQHILAGFSKMGIPFEVGKLEYGDYACMYENIFIAVVIERKASLEELAGNFCKGRKRFKAEFERAKEGNCKVVLLLEDADARKKMVLRKELDKDSTFDKKKKLSKTWKTYMTANSMIASLKSFKEKYDLDLIFCNKQETAKEMLKIFENYIEEAEL